MKLIKNAEFGGERPLFESHDLRLENVIIRTGESAIKECSNIEAVDCRFEGNYPFWHVHGFKIDRCYFDVGGRSALWYSDHLKMTDTIIDAPKMFREMDEIDIENVTMNDADEVFWRCNGIRIKNLKLHSGTYPFMFSNNIYVDGLESNSKYVRIIAVQYPGIERVATPSALVMLFLPIVNRSVFITDEKLNTARNYHVASLVEIVL